MKFTQKALSALTLSPGEDDKIYWHPEQKGFGFRLRRFADKKTVGRSWVVQYRHAGRSPRIKLGDYETVGLEQAYAAAKKLLAKVALGEDPQASRAKERHTFKASVADFLAMKKRDLRVSTYRELVRYLTGAYFKPLHSSQLDQISRKDVAAQLNRISLTSGSIVAAHARTALTGFFSWAVAHGLCESNPVVGTLKPKGSPPRERVLADDELAKIWNACDDDSEHSKIIRLLICLAGRRGEVGGMAWSELDLEGPQPSWTLAASRSKSKRPHPLPLMPMALAIIESVPRMASRDQLFGLRGPSGFTTWVREKARLDQRSGVSGWTTHDIRRSVATKLADIGVMPHLIEEILNHRSGHRRGVAGVYNRSSYEREVRAALALWEDHLRTLIEGGERKVLPLRPQAS
jgi:integrase